MAPRILVVDDDESFRFLLVEALTKENYEIVAAASGEQALEIYQKQGPFEVITLDIKMPGIDGFEVLSRIKEINENQLIVIITAYGAQKIAIEAVKKGAYDYFTKPFDIDELRLVIGRALECNRLNCENRQLRQALKERLEI